VFLRFEIDQVYQNDLVQGSPGCSSGCSSAGCIHEPTPTRTSGSSIYPAVQNMLLAARALGLGATLTTLYLQFEEEAEAALGLPPGFHSYALLPIGYPVGRSGQSAVSLSPMWFTKIGGASLTEIRVGQSIA
jgi:nitroreductase